MKGAALPGAAGRRAPMIRAALMLALATARYRASVAGETHTALEGWGRGAGAIGEPRLRDLALGKLADERLNAEGAGMLGVLAPRAHRSSAVRAMIALQVLYDYLDAVSESEARADTDEDGELYEPFTGAFSAGRPQGESRGDSGYTRELSATVKAGLAQLPGAEQVGTVLAAGAERCAEAQQRVHAIPHAGIAQARAWAQERCEGALSWQETLAGAAACVVGLHAVLGAAADERTSAREAEAIDRLYLSISAVTALLDSVTDRPRDESSAELGFTSLYDSEGALADGLARATQQAVADTAHVRHGAFHLAMLAGIIGYYATAEGADSDYARPLMAEARGQLGPLVALTLPVWRRWRTAHNNKHTR